MGEEKPFCPLPYILPQKGSSPFILLSLLGILGVPLGNQSLISGLPELTGEEDSEAALGKCVRSDQ